MDATITPAGAVRLEQIVNEIKACIKRTGLEIIVIGQRLAEARDILYGGFGRWIEDELNMSERMARNFMYVAHRFANTPEIISAVPPTVLYSLAAPSTPDKVISVVLDRVKQGEIVKVREVKALIAEQRPARRTVAEVMAEAQENVIQEVIATGGYVAVGGETIAAALTEQTAEGLRSDGEVIRNRIEREQGLKDVPCYRGKMTVISVDERRHFVTFLVPDDLMTAVGQGEIVNYVIYVKRREAGGNGI